MREFVLATGNAHKLSEVRAILAGADVTVRGLDEFPGVTPAPEDGDTFEVNAAIKAESVAARIGSMVVADDSGLMVDALDGAPGVFSARYAGSDGDHAANNARLLKELDGVAADARTARFVCVIAVAAPGKTTRLFHGRTEGRILDELRGKSGFGYDPLFLSNDLGMSFAEADASKKNEVSHRGRALAQFAGALSAGEFDTWMAEDS